MVLQPKRRMLLVSGEAGAGEDLEEGEAGVDSADRGADPEADLAGVAMVLRAAHSLETGGKPIRFAAWPL